MKAVRHLNFNLVSFSKMADIGYWGILDLPYTAKKPFCEALRAWRHAIYHSYNILSLSETGPRYGSYPYMITNKNGPVAQIPQCTSTIFNYAVFVIWMCHMCAFLSQNGVLCDVCLMLCGICEAVLLQAYAIYTSDVIRPIDLCTVAVNIGASLSFVPWMKNIWIIPIYTLLHCGEYMSRCYGVEARLSYCLCV